jgi:hypothetical protein
MFRIFLFFYCSLFLVKVCAEDLGSCDNTGCVILEVPIKLESYVSSPSQIRKSHNGNVDGEVTNYETIITRTGDTCVKQVKVPKPVYIAVTQVLASMGNFDTEPPPILTPAQQSILLFYSTLLQQTLGFQCSPRDFSTDRNITDNNNSSNAPADDSNSGKDSSNNPQKDPFSGKEWGVFNGYMESEDSILFFFTHNEFSRTARVDDIIYGDWIISGFDRKKKQMILKNGLKLVSVGVNQPIIFP